jgi:hypothetical protein
VQEGPPSRKNARAGLLPAPGRAIQPSWFCAATCSLPRHLLKPSLVRSTFHSCRTDPIEVPQRLWANSGLSSGLASKES